MRVNAQKQTDDGKDLFMVLRDVFNYLEYGIADTPYASEDEFHVDLNHLRETATLSPPPGQGPEVHQAIFALVRSLLQEQRTQETKKRLKEMTTAVRDLINDEDAKGLL